jgi:arylsulfatase A-like enzyme
MRLAIAMGAVSGTAEVALRVERRMGLTIGEAGTWLLWSIGLALLVTIPVALVASLLERRNITDRGAGLVLSALLALHGALYFRFNYVLNLSVSDFKVWGSLVLVAVVSLVLGLILDRYLRRSSRPLYALAAVSIVFTLSRSGPTFATSAADSSPNVLLVTFDTTRADRIGAWGGAASTPNIDGLARDGVRFSQAIAPAPLTEASHLSILTGLPVYQTGVVANGTILGDRPALLSRRFSDAGYVTGGFVSGFPLHGKYGWTQGFDVYDDDFGVTAGLHRLTIVKAWDQLTLPGNTLRERPGRQTIDRALGFVEENSEKPFFMWVHLFDPHAPYDVSDEELLSAPRDGEPLELPYYWPPPHASITSTDWLIEAYENEISKTDALFGELLDALEREGITENTIVAFTADHGESLLEHDYLFDHGDYLYDASLWVPLVIKAPQLAVSGLVQDCQVSLIHVAPTLADLAGIQEIEPTLGSGVSLRDELLGGNCVERPAVSSNVAARFVDDPPVDHALRTILDHGVDSDDNPLGRRPSKYILHGEGGESLYDLMEDPVETVNLSDVRSNTASSARAVVERLLDGGTEIQSPESDAGTIEALRALGYVE